ncbi:hypothetical protein [Jannaschia aquimarina]|uniref:Lipoprotein n=1 Tax=Jannaschia aquimarina TaxID=935700 RepID=A0A0D1EKX6_9RHOB|nr:hypothetical protein [Jannaschia aquimarina]KIT17641.1 hypothetical protein jaqu_05320 [Jannaschia aquimarina]SNS80178.1 hypothetical protein SAMN05421775_102349 [Jannaschia aquimarina]
MMRLSRLLFALPLLTLLAACVDEGEGDAPDLNPTLPGTGGIPSDV